MLKHTDYGRYYRPFDSTYAEHRDAPFVGTSGGDETGMAGRKVRNDSGTNFRHDRKCERSRMTSTKFLSEPGSLFRRLEIPRPTSRYHKITRLSPPHDRYAFQSVPDVLLFSAVVGVLPKTSNVTLLLPWLRKCVHHIYALLLSRRKAKRLASTPRRRSGQVQKQGLPYLAYVRG